MIDPIKITNESGYILDRAVRRRKSRTARLVKSHDPGPA